MGKGINFPDVDGSKKRIAIVRTMWNSEYVDVLEKRCIQALQDCGVSDTNIVVKAVPGAYELSYGAKQMIQQDGIDAVVCLGVLLKGETMHFEYISEALTQGLMRVGLDTDVPVIFGVLTCLNEEQVLARIDEKGKDHGYEWGKSAVYMSHFHS